MGTTTLSVGATACVPITYSVTPSAAGFGTISPNTVQTVAYGNTTSFSVTANAGYNASVASGAGLCGGNLTGTAPNLSFATLAITAHCAVNATFTLAPVQCAAGTYSASGNSPCTTASPGNFVATAGATAQTACVPGSYQPASAATACLPAQAGFYVSAAGAIAQTPCALGTSSTAGATLCTGLPILNIDNSSGSSQYAAASDGTLLIRYLLGLRGTALTQGALDATALRDAAQIEVHLATYLMLFDVDGDGQVHALTDGLMILRRLLGLSGTALTAGAKNSARSDADIAAAIDALRP